MTSIFIDTTVHSSKMKNTEIKKKLKEYGIVRKKERVCFYGEKDFSYNTYLIIQNKRYVSTGELRIHAN